MTQPVHVEDLDPAIEEYKSRGYRLDVIFPADDPQEARMSRGEETLVLSTAAPDGKPPKGGTQNTWIRGRAGMEYRDLLPDRLGGKIIASHIRLIEGGPVPDYVHYHKIDFQMIYCKSGSIKVVYEDQGEPFWLETGDLVVQPPEIRHRVLECTAGAEVIEITSPAEHETWVEHEMELPNSLVDREREFGGQQFFRFQATDDQCKSRSPMEAILMDVAILLRLVPNEIGTRRIITAFSQSLSRM